MTANSSSPSGSASRSRNPLDPSADAANLFRRVGFLTLALLLPLAALVSRRAGVVLAPIGVGLLIASAVTLDPRRFLQDLRDTVAGPASLLLLGLTGWVFLAAGWSPYRTGMEKALNLGFAAALGIFGIAALPRRVRASNLNLVALGVAAAAVLAMLLSFGEMRGVSLMNDADGGSLSRGLGLVAVIVWPALAWLLSRGRGVAALALAATVTIVALMRFGQGGATVVVAGAATFGLVSIDARRGGLALGLLCAGAMALAPLLPFLVEALGPLLPSDWTPRAGAARAVILAEPVKMITGHGLDSMLRGKIFGTLSVAAPNSLLFETWYELGVVGALGAAVCLFLAIRNAAQMPGALAAGGVTAYVTAFLLAALGTATLQFWWLVLLASVGILFAAVARGQMRTDRPLAPRFFNRSAPPPEASP